MSVIIVNERPFTTVDTEAQFDAALAAGRWVLIRGEGTGGVIQMTTPKTINNRFTEIRGPGKLQFNMAQGLTGGLPGSPTAGEPGSGIAPNTPTQSPRAITINADDVTLRNFTLSGDGLGRPLSQNTSYGVCLQAGASSPGHRLRMIDMVVHDWARCISKDDAAWGGSGKTAVKHEDILIDRCLFHNFWWTGALLEYGFRRLKMRDTRIYGHLDGVTPPSSGVTHHNCLYGGSNWIDCDFEDCHFGNNGRISFEARIATYDGYVMERLRLSNCTVKNSLGMGISTMFGIGTLIEKCKIKDVHYIGIENGGRSPENPPAVYPNYRLGTGIIDSCEIDNVTSWSMDGFNGSGQAIGISLDGAHDTVVRGGTKISNIYSTHIPGDAAAGIAVANSERCSVRGATLKNAGRAAIYITRGEPGVNYRGFHEVVGNTIRDVAGAWPYPEPQMAVEIHDTTVEVRDNVAWAKIPLNLRYRAQCVLPAKVTVDGVAVPASTPPEYLHQYFGGSNLLLFGGDYPDPL